MIGGLSAAAQRRLYRVTSSCLVERIAGESPISNGGGAGVRLKPLPGPLRQQILPVKGHVHRTTSDDPRGNAGIGEAYLTGRPFDSMVRPRVRLCTHSFITSMCSAAARLMTRSKVGRRLPSS